MMRESDHVWVAKVVRESHLLWTWCIPRLETNHTELEKSDSSRISTFCDSKRLMRGSAGLIPVSVQMLSGS